MRHLLKTLGLLSTSWSPKGQSMTGTSEFGKLQILGYEGTEFRLWPG